MADNINNLTKLYVTTTNNNRKYLNNHASKIPTYAQTQPIETKAFHTIQLWNRSDLCYRSCGAWTNTWYNGVL